MNKRYLFIVFILLAIQFIKPSVNRQLYSKKTDFLAVEKPSKSISNQFKIACYNCHSNTTQYPWYAHITPVNFWINHHINEAKKELNFSAWSKYSVKNKIHALNECIEALKEDKMPLQSYQWLHKEAEISDKNSDEMINWLEQLKIKYELIPPPM